MLALIFHHHFTRKSALTLSMGHCLLFRAVARGPRHYSAAVDALPPEARLKHHDEVYPDSGWLSLFLPHELDLQTHRFHPNHLGVAASWAGSDWSLWHLRVLFPQEVSSES